MVKTQEQIDLEIAATVARQRAEDELAKKAAATPFPGELRGAFATMQDIPVGKWNVRPFVDRDVQLLQELDHPLYRIALDWMAGKKSDVEYMPRGEPAWIAAWMFTRPAREVRQAIKDKTIAEKADAEFGDLRVVELTAMSNAIMKHLDNYFRPVLDYGPAEEGEKGSPPS